MDIEEFRKKFKQMVEDAYEGRLQFGRIMASPGIPLTKAICEAYDAGDLLGAQALILAEIEKQPSKADE